MTGVLREILTKNARTVASRYVCGRNRFAIDAIGQVGQVRHRTNTTKQGSWPTQSNLANFICDVGRDARVGIGGPRRLDRTLRISNANELCQVGQVRHRANTTKHGSWSTRSKLANFICDMCANHCRSLEDFQTALVSLFRPIGPLCRIRPIS